MHTKMHKIVVGRCGFLSFLFAKKKKILDLKDEVLSNLNLFLNKVKRLEINPSNSRNRNSVNMHVLIDELVKSHFLAVKH